MDQRLHTIRKLLSDTKLDSILITSPIIIGYLTDYFGFSLVEREAYMLVTNKSQSIFTDARYTHEVSEVCKTLRVCEISSVTPLSSHLTNITQKENITIMGFDPSDMTVAEYKRCKVAGTKLSPLSLRTLREQKDMKEIMAIAKACEIGDNTFAYIQTQIKEGMTERDVADLMERYIRNNHATLSFATIAAFGKNAAIPHHHTDDTKLKKGQEILLDFGVKYDNYCSDMTRTIYFGSVSEKQTKIYQTVKTAQQKAIDYIKDTLQNKKNISLAEVDTVAREYILSKGFPTIPHGLGHGIGLEVHESPSLSPRSQDKLSEGMVFSIEPGIYFADIGGVRIEDLFSVQNNKLIQLTNASSDLTII